MTWPETGVRVTAQGSVTVIATPAELDPHQAPYLRREAIAAIDAGCRALVVDMTAAPTEFLDSTGLAVMVGILKRLREHDGAMAIACDLELILKAFRITNLTKVFRIYGSVDDAVAALTGMSGAETPEGFTEIPVAPAARERGWKKMRRAAVKAAKRARGQGAGTKAMVDAVLAVFDEEALARYTEELVGEARIRAMTIRDGKQDLEIAEARTIAAMWAAAARTMLKDAPNYAETEMQFKEAGDFTRYAFTIQRVGKLTPHQARQAAEAEVARLRERVAELEKQLAVLTRGEEG